MYLNTFELTPLHYGNLVTLLGVTLWRVKLWGVTLWGQGL